MIGSRLGRRRHLQLSAAFATLFAAAVVLGWRAGGAPTAAPPAAVPAPWALPQPTESAPARDAAVLKARHPWGGGGAFHDIDSAPAALAASRTPWQLAGIVERGNERYALILVGQGPSAKLEYRATGDSLPDGSVLVQIGADSATSEGGQPAPAGRRVHRLFEKAP